MLNDDVHFIAIADYIFRLWDIIANSVFVN